MYLGSRLKLALIRLFKRTRLEHSYQDLYGRSKACPITTYSTIYPSLLQCFVVNISHQVVRPLLFKSWPWEDITTGLANEHGEFLVELLPSTRYDRHTSSTCQYYHLPSGTLPFIWYKDTASILSTIHVWVPESPSIPANHHRLHRGHRNLSIYPSSTCGKYHHET